MATSKTLTPTNVTIQIPDFTDQPDQRVNSNCIDKEADAINALNGKIGSDGTQVKHGRQTMRVNQSASGYDPSTSSVSFTTPFADANYHVVLTNTNGGGGDWNQIVIAALSITKDGFSIVANDNKVGSATNILVYVDWVAIHN